MNTLQEKVVLITGGAKRVGAAICRLLHERGALLKRHCEQKLAEAKMKVEKISFSADGSVSSQPADLG